MLNVRTENLLETIENIAKRADEPRSGIAAKMADLLRAAIDAISPGGLEIEVISGERGLPQIINIPKKVVVASRKRAKKITLIDQWDRELSDDLAALAKALHQLPFYYGLFEMGADNKLMALSQEIASIEPGTLPLSINADDTGGADILWLVLSPDKKNGGRSSCATGLRE